MLRIKSGHTSYNSSAFQIADVDRSRGFGILMFSRPEAAQATAIAMNGAQLNGRIIAVREERDLNAPRKKKSLRKPNPAAAAPQPPVVSGTAGRGGIGGERKVSAEKGRSRSRATGYGSYGRLSINVTPSNVCFVSNLNWNSTDDDLFQHFCLGVTPLSAKVEIGFYHNNGGLFVPHSKGWALSYLHASGRGCCGTKVA